MNIKKENVLKAHEAGCPDVKSVLENLFPELFVSKIPEISLNDTDSGEIEVFVDKFHSATINGTKYLQFINNEERGLKLLFLHNENGFWENEDGNQINGYLTFYPTKK